MNNRLFRKEIDMEAKKAKSLIANIASELIVNQAVRNSSVGAISNSFVPKFHPVQRQTVQNMIYESLKDAIMKGQIAPGTKLEVNELANRFGTSPMPVREALSRLVESGALVTQPNKSVSMPLLKSHDLVELGRIRMTIEGMAGIWAAEHVTDEEIKLMEGYCDQLVECIRQKDKSQAAEVNEKIHFAIYAATRFEKLIPIVERLWMQNGPYFSLLSWDVFRSGDRLHRKMIEGLKNRNGLAVQKAIETDIFDALNSLLNVPLSDDIRPTVSLKIGSEV
jgi:DNA-binding GntR family transcriptional regulator